MGCNLRILQACFHPSDFSFLMSISAFSLQALSFSSFSPLYHSQLTRMHNGVSRWKNSRGYFQFRHRRRLCKVYPGTLDSWLYCIHSKVDAFHSDSSLHRVGPIKPKFGCMQSLPYKSFMQLVIPPSRSRNITICCSDFFHFRIWGYAVIEPSLIRFNDIQGRTQYFTFWSTFIIQQTLAYFSSLRQQLQRGNPQLNSLTDDQYFLPDKWPKVPFI